MSFLLSLLFLLAAPAQQTAAQNPADLCTIRGVVVKAGTGEPLHQATVEAWSEDRDSESSAAEAQTDAMGRFELKGLPPGRYTLLAHHTGFVEQQYGQRTPDGPGAIISLARGQTVPDITFQMIPAAVITGHVYDENDEPIMWARVQAMHYMYFRGQHRLVASGTEQTNDLGEFRIFGLSPGQYIVQATAQINRPASAKSKQGYAPVYYPGVPDAGRATPITLQAGEVFPGADISLQSVKTVAVRGKILSAGCNNAAQGAMVFLQKVSADNLNLSADLRDTTDAQGAFRFPSVLPASYYLYGALFDEEKMCFGRRALEAADADIDGITLTLNAGIEVKGRVRVEGQLDSNLGSIEVNLAPKIISIPFGVGIPGSGKADGSFTLKSVFDGDYEITVGNLPDSYFVKSARLDGVDVLTAGVTVDTKQAPGSLEILVSPNGATLDGVISKDHQPFPKATVALVPDPPNRGINRLFKSTSTDQNGHFTLQGISPGDYKVFAWEKIEAGAYTSPEFLRPFENRGESVHITEGSHNSVQVDLIPEKDSSAASNQVSYSR
jgi:hypothetical protein